MVVADSLFLLLAKNAPRFHFFLFLPRQTNKIEEMEKNNLKEEEWNTYECEVYLSHCSCITKYVKAPTLEAAIAYLEKKYPEATCVIEADHWR